MSEHDSNDKNEHDSNDKNEHDSNDKNEPDDGFDGLRLVSDLDPSDVEPGYDVGRLPGVIQSLIYLSPPDFRRRYKELVEAHPHSGMIRREPHASFGFYVGPEGAPERICGFHESALLGDDA